jgi:predicted RNase H-like HicB family nuclease
VEFPELGGAYTDGKTLQEAAYNAIEVAELILTEYVEENKPLPTPVFNHARCADAILFAVPVELDDEKIRAMHYVPLAEAAAMLSVGKPRVSNLVKAGRLDSIGAGTARLISLESINARLAASRSAGRPRKPRELQTA